MTTKQTSKSKNTNRKNGGRRGQVAPRVGRRGPAPKRGRSPSRNGAVSLGPPQPERARKLALAIADAGLEKKALNVEVIDVHDKVDYADYVVVMSGRSDRQVGAIARGVEEQVKERGLGRCLGVEGLPQGNWVLMDFGDVVVHVFHEDMRGYYDLESLWIDAARVQVAEG